MGSYGEFLEEHQAGRTVVCRESCGVLVPEKTEAAVEEGGLWCGSECLCFVLNKPKADREKEPPVTWDLVPLCSARERLPLLP